MIHTPQLLEDHRRPRRSIEVMMLAAALVLGLVWRVTVYAADVDVTVEEAFLLHNFMQETPGGAFEPLENDQVAPPMYRWLVGWLLRATVGEWAVRAPSLAASLGALALFAWLAGRVVRGGQWWLAVSMFAVSHPVATYAGRAKQYTVESLCTLVIICLAVGWLGGRRVGWLAALAVACPVLIWASHTSLLVSGAVLALIAARLMTTDRGTGLRWARAWFAWAAAAVGTGLSLGLLYRLDLRPALDAAGAGTISRFWADAYPPIADPLALAWWLIETHTGRMLGYPIGDKNFASVVQAALWLAGIVWWWRRRDRWVLAVLLLPQAVLLIIAAMKLYPYGGHARVNVFLAPAFCLLITCGGYRLSRMMDRPHHRWVVRVAAGLFIAVALGGMTLAIHQRFAAYRPTPRDVLRTVAADARPGDAMINLGRAQPQPRHPDWLAVHEYYLVRLLGDRLTWPQPETPPAGRVWVIAFGLPGREDRPDATEQIDRWLARVNAPARTIEVRRSAKPRPTRGQLEIRLIEFDAQP